MQGRAALAALDAGGLDVLRCDGADFGERLRSENFLPRRGAVWHAASVLDLLRSFASIRSPG